MKNKDYSNLSYEEILAIPVEEARKSWTGEIGEERAKEIEAFIRKTTKNYSEVLGYTEEEVLRSLEQNRNYSAINYYQKASQPELGEDVLVFAGNEEFFARFPSSRYRCPACGGVSTDMSVCDSGDLLDGKPCNWKAYGLFRTMGKGIRVVRKDAFLDEPIVHEIFKPIELETV